MFSLNPFRRKRKASDFQEEIAAHIAAEIERLRAEGFSEEEAHNCAHRAFGNVAKTQERFYESRHWLFWDNLWRDIRFALRMLRKSPGFTAVAILTLGLGIGANTAIFTLINAVLLQPLPGIAKPSQLVSLYRMQKNDPFGVNGYPDYVDYRDRNRSFSGLAAHAAIWMNLGTGMPERIIGDIVTGNYFPVLGVRPALGRLIDPDDNTKGTPMLLSC